MDITVKELLSSFAQIAIVLMMLSMGLVLGFKGITRLWRRPFLLFRGLLAAFVVVPVAAMAVVHVLPLSFATRAGIAAMVVIPGAPTIYRKTLQGDGDAELAGSFQASTALACILLVPLWFVIISALYPEAATAPVATVVKQVMYAQGIPLILGAGIRQWFPELAEDFNEPLSRVSNAMLVGVILLVLAIGLPLVIKAGVLPIVAVTFLAAVALVSGHYLGGGDPVSRQTIATANATRNTGLAIAMITLNFPDARHGILITIASYAVISAIACKIYSRLYQKRLARSADMPKPA